MAEERNKQVARLDECLTGLQSEINTDLQRIKMLDNPSTIRYMENDISRLEKEVVEVESQKQVLTVKKSYDIQQIKAKLKHLVQHLGETVRQRMNSVQKAQLFGLFFNKLPTYAQLAGATPGASVFTGVNSIFLPKFKETLDLAAHS